MKKVSYEGVLLDSPRLYGRLRDGSPIVRARFLSGDFKCAVTAFRTRGQQMLDFLHKGDLIKVDGEIRRHEFVKGRAVLRSVEIVADDITFLGGGE
jgi:hypothetical protein